MGGLALLAQSADARGLIDSVLDPQVLPIFIPIVAIVGGIAYAITAAIIRHRERMVRIQQGIDPIGADDSESRPPLPSGLRETVDYKNFSRR